MVNHIPSWQPASENYTPVKLAILAPRWLQEALGILLLSDDSFTLVANTQNEDMLFSLSLSQMPDIILIDTDRRLKKAVDQITRIKAKIQSANYVMLVDKTSQYSPLIQAGADAVILKGSPPSSILEMIKQVAEKRRNEIKEKNKPHTGSLSRKTGMEA